MSETSINLSTLRDQIFCILNPNDFLIVGLDQDTFSVYPEEKGDSNLLRFAKIFSGLPVSSWLHLVTLENQPIFVLSYAIDQNQTAFLTYPSTTRIRQLEERLVLLQKTVNQQPTDPRLKILQELTTSDLKIGSVEHSKHDDFLAIFTDLEKSYAKKDTNILNQGDTQPITL